VLELLSRDRPRAVAARPANRSDRPAYGVYDHKTPAAPGQERLYRIEFWPIGNRFRRGHRLRLHVLGTSAASLPGAPAVNTIRVGGHDGSRLLFPCCPAATSDGVTVVSERPRTRRARSGRAEA